MNETLCTLEVADAYFEYKLDAGDWFTTRSETTAATMPEINIMDNGGQLNTLRILTIGAVNHLSVSPAEEGETATPVTIDRRIKALITATRSISRLAFSGKKTDSNQVLPFPRDGKTTIPTYIQYACAEEALYRLRGKDPETEVAKLRNQAMTFASVKVTKDTAIIPPHLMSGVVSHEAWLYIEPYLVDQRSVRVVRT